MAIPEGRTNVLPSPQAKPIVTGVESVGKKGLPMMDGQLDTSMITWEKDSEAPRR
jgi:hypothetical protein